VAILYRGEDSAGAREAVTLVMMIVSTALPFAVIAMGWRQLLIAVDLHNRAAKTAAFASLVGAVTAIVLTWMHGITGAAIGVAVSAFCSAVSLGIVAHRAIGRAAAVPGWRGGAVAWAAGMLVALLAARDGATLEGVLLSGAAPLVTFAGFAASGLLTRQELALLASKLSPRRQP
jgi:O-antigen/teichoic acid export membrane protein